MTSKEKAYMSILALTNLKDWMDDPETVVKVQEYGKYLSIEKEPNTKYANIAGIHVKDANEVVRKYRTLEECIEKEALSRATITRHIKRETKSKDGRRFSLL